MRRHRVFILYECPLFAEGVRRLLGSCRDLEVVGMEKDRAKAMAAVRGLQPDTLLVEGVAGADELPAGVTELVLDHVVGSVIGFSLARNSLTVLRRQRIEVNAVDDLVTAITGA